jgi:hypothetical protein
MALRQRWTLSRARRLEQKGRYDEAIDVLNRAAARSRDMTVLEPMTRLRQKAFAAAPHGPGRAEWPPSYPDCFDVAGTPPEVDLEGLDSEALGAGLVHHGCLLVRGLLSPSRTAEVVAAVENAFRAADGSTEVPAGWYVPAEAVDGLELGFRRSWDRSAGAIWAGDSPPALFTLFRAFEEIGLDRVLEGYFGERPVVSLEKMTLRLTTPEAQNAWHQDGAFMGASLRTVNVWIALTPCGADADCPGLDVLPKRVDEIVPTGTHGAPLPDFVSPEVIAGLAEDCPVTRPRFEAGDALIFDDRFLHSTGVSPGMSGNRLAIECWFFSGATVPDDYVPMAF